MAAVMDNSRVDKVLRKFDPHSRLLRAWELTGGVSAQVTALEVEGPDGQTKKMVVRLHGGRDLQSNPEVATLEFRLLKILHAAGVSVPAPYYLDRSCEISSTPYLVIEFVEGETVFAPVDVSDYLRQFATQLALIHRVDCSGLDVSFLPRQAERYADMFRERPDTLDESLDERRIRDALESGWPVPQRNESVLVHGDYWPGNTLWKDGQLVAVIDWEDAHFGDPLADLANSRLEILWAFGIDAMHAFTQLYQSMTEIDLADLPYWDLCVALGPSMRFAEWVEDDATEQRMRSGYRAFTAQALGQLTGR